MSRMLQEILNYIDKNPGCSSTQISQYLNNKISLATVKRKLDDLLASNEIYKIGLGKTTKYFIDFKNTIVKTIDLNSYFLKDVNQRDIQKQFNNNLIFDLLPQVNIFDEKELDELNKIQNIYIKNISELTAKEFQNAMDHLAIDLSWKSSEIEGNTYSLLETEQLLKEKKTAQGKTKDEAIMLLNHKDAIDFLVDNPDFMYPLTVTKIENLHSILIKELGVSKNIRQRKVSITGTDYAPLDNEWQIKEALEAMCKMVNNKESIFEKALLAILLISYIQPFMDGNKRTARIVGNSILMHFKYCPLSFRTVDSIDYKKAILLFYEINNVSAFKKLFMEQYKFAVDTYF
jgi:Fic family protein